MNATGAKVLLVEDDRDDAELVTALVRESVPGAEVTHVDNEKSFRRALRAGHDIVLADYTMPSFGAGRVIEIVDELGLDVPVVVVSGAIGEDLAIEAMRRGAADYLLKDRLGRIGQAIEQALQRRDLLREKVRVEAELARSERRLRAMIDSEPECVKLVSREGIVLDMNPAGAKMLDATPDEIIGKPLAPLLYSEDRFAFWNLHKAVLAGETGKLVFRVVGKRGTVRWMETHSAPLYDEDGGISSVLSVTRDITEARKVEERLRENDTVLRQLAENIDEVFWLMEVADKRLVYVSPAFEVVWGRPRGDRWPDSVHPDDRDEFRRETTRQTDTETRRRYRIIRPDGEVREISERTFPVRDRAGKPYRVAGIAQDITE